MAGRPLLPTHVQRHGPGTGIGSILKMREKYVLAAVVGLFIFFSLLGMYYLPDLKGTVYLSYLKKPSALGPNLLDGLMPPEQRGAGNDLNVLLPPIEKSRQDEQRLRQKIDEYFNFSQQAVIPRPILNSASSSIDSLKLYAPGAGGARTLNSSTSSEDRQPVVLPDGKDPDPEMQTRRDTIKKMMIEAWDNYKQYAWGHNELKPLSRKGHSASIFGSAKLGATIVDGMDTLWIMGLKDRFHEGREWIKDNLDFSVVKSEMSVFETIIRFVGGLLSCYAFTKDEMFLKKAVHVTDLMLPAFDTPTGLPRSLIKPATGQARNFPWASGGSSILAEVGSLYLEFYYLSKMSGNEDYLQRAERILQLLDSINKPEGLYYNYINPKTGKFAQQHVSIGALADSYYEYLLKTWLISGKVDQTSLRMYNQAADALVKHLLQNSTHGLAYFADKKYQRLEHKMGHLACFSAGMFALGAKENAHLDDKKNSYYLDLGAQLANTCHESYNRTKTGLGPETFWFSGELEAQSGTANDRYYILRPEVIEGWFYMWRLTKERKYRDWAWAATEAIQKYCHSPAGTGYTGINNVNSEHPKQDDVQQSFFLAETLKYLYLIFSADDLMPLDEWVFNTEAHPFPITHRHRRI